MDSYIVKVLQTEFVTQNVKRFVVEKPAGYSFMPGQATDVAINHPGLATELRPFTFTSHTTDHYLEFIIKIYTGHDGITEKLAAININDELIIHEVFGSIAYKGPGIFIAGGSGITPFIAIFRHLKSDGKLAGNTLLFANNTSADIILKEELREMLDKNYIDILKQPATHGTGRTLIDLPLLKQYTSNGAAYYYICGPDPFTSAMVRNLQSLGITKAQIIIEE
jgi:ferredoxin-NADP reductase